MSTDSTAGAGSNGSSPQEPPVPPAAPPAVEVVEGVLEPPEGDPGADGQGASQQRHEHHAGRSEHADGDDGEGRARARFQRLFERMVKRVGSVRLGLLIKNNGSATETFRTLPRRMHQVANQTQLVLELVDDYRTGVYRKIPWRSIAVLGGVAAYLLSPIDIIPDALLGFGVLDDMLVMALAGRVMRSDLKDYCIFKGYDIEDYFGPV